MATPAEVIDLFADVRQGSSFDRAKAAAAAFRAFGSLDPAEKRELAVMVAEHAAPQLVPKIRAETGLDLTREQVQAVIDMAGRMDAEDIEELRQSVRDPETRDDALRGIGATAAAAAAEATGLDDVIAPPEEQPPAPHGDGEVDDVVEDTPGPETLDVDDSELDDLGVESELVELDPEPEPSSPVEPAPEPKQFESVFDDLPGLPAFEARASGGTMTPDRLERIHDTPDLTTRVRALRHPLVERLHEQTTGAGALRVLRTGLDALVDMDPVSRTAVVDAIPDGWARRRALQSMLDAQVLPAVEVPDLIRRVGSPVARTWLCASAIETDLLHVDQLEELLAPRAAARLRGRYR